MRDVDFLFEGLVLLDLILLFGLGKIPSYGYFVFINAFRGGGGQIEPFLRPRANKPVLDDGFGKAEGVYYARARA